ncbi:MAG: 3-deoxy-D-manno-octulosonic acid transferase [Deltaproteobacteria bacterium]|nr:3-deoxy-D-manno-octulosonic acid transferase [Deltaproteobacteria bacterium]
MIFLYNILFFMVMALGIPLIIPMVLISDKRRKTVLQRLGIARLPREFVPGKTVKPVKKPIWVHALSVGEVLSSVPLVKGLKECSNTRDIVFSASTKTGFDIARQYLTDTVDSIFYFPYDLTFSVKHIVQRIDPAVVVIVETDIWPNFLFEMKKRRVPVILVNARLSKKSFSGYKRLGFFTKKVFLNFFHICAQSLEDAWRFQELGVPFDRITTTGNVKFDEAHQIRDSQEIDGLRQSMHMQNARKVFLAGSTHPGEESILLDAFSRIKHHVGNLLLIVAPRNPERAGSVFRIFDSAGFSVGLMKELEKISSGKRLDVIIIDTMGLLKTLYAMADIAFVGGSLVNCGGHNPLEPAAFSKPIIFGPDMSDFRDISRMLLDAGGAVRVKDAKELYNALVSLVENDRRALEMGKNALGVLTANQGAVEKTITVIKPYL